MTESERLLRSILGPTRSDIRPLAFAIAVAEELLFNQGLAMDDVQITKQIYPMVARQFRKTDNAAAKCVERLSRLCWEAMVAQNLVAQYLGRAIQQSPTPRSLIVYLAVYSHTGSPLKRIRIFCSSCRKAYKAPHLLIRRRMNLTRRGERRFPYVPAAGRGWSCKISIPARSDRRRSPMTGHPEAASQDPC